MANLPLNVNLSKLIFLGHIFSCLKDCIIMATGCSLANIFSSPFQEKIYAYLNRLQWADGSCSDLIAYLNLFQVWQKKKRSNAFSDAQSERNWARQHYVNLRALNEWNILVNEITQRCKNLGIQESVGQARVTLNSIEIPLFLKIAMCGAFYPNYFKRSSDGGQVDEREAVRTLGGRNPCTTVYFQNMDRAQPGSLYARRIKEFFSFTTAKLNIFFDQSFRVYVEFTPVSTSGIVRIDGREFITGIPGKICKEVYCAVRRRQLKLSNVIHCLPHEDSWQFACTLGLAEKTKQGNYKLVKRPRYRHPSAIVLPDLDIHYIKICISHPIDAFHFWAQNLDQETAHNLQEIQKQLNSVTLTPVVKKDIKVEQVYAAKYKSDNYYYRCKIIPNTHWYEPNPRSIQVIFIDYGNIQSTEICSLCYVPEEILDILPQAMECVLSEVQPSVMSSKSADDAFKNYTENGDLFGKVYSVVNDIIHLELFKEIPRYDTQNVMSLNKQLIEKGLAVKAEESFLSKENNLARENLRNSESKDSKSTIFEDNNFIEAAEVEPPHIGTCTRNFILKGPFSPLEMQIFSVMESGLQKTATIEGTSVNCVLLDTDPQDPHERLIVAVNVGESATSRSLHLRHTTVMPNIHGFAVLMAVLFCPNMELKPVADGSRFGAVLCGLGPLEGGRKSTHAAHDMVFTLDVELTQDILTEINEIRYWMNVMVRAMDGINNHVDPSIDIETCQREIKERVLNTLKKPRKSVERSYVKHANTWQKFLYTGTILQCEDHGIMENEIWPLHRSMVLKVENDETAALKENLREMSRFATQRQTMSESTCKLCNVVLYTVPEVRLHLVSKNHLDKVQAVIPDATDVDN